MDDPPLVQVFNHVKAYLETQVPGISVVFGYAEETKNYNQGIGGANRVVIVPGDRHDIMCEFDPPKHPGANPKEIWRVVERFKVVMWAEDSEDQHNPIAQYTAGYLMFRYVMRAFASVNRFNIEPNPGTFYERDRGEHQSGDQRTIEFILTWPVTDEKLPMLKVGAVVKMKADMPDGSVYTEPRLVVIPRPRRLLRK